LIFFVFVYVVYITIFFVKEQTLLRLEIFVYTA